MQLRHYIAKDSLMGEKKRGETQHVSHKGLKSNCGSYVLHGWHRAKQSIDETGLARRFLSTKSSSFRSRWKQSNLYRVLKTNPLMYWDPKCEKQQQKDWNLSQQLKYIVAADVRHRCKSFGNIWISAQEIKLSLYSKNNQFYLFVASGTM